MKVVEYRKTSGSGHWDKGHNLYYMGDGKARSAAEGNLGRRLWPLLTGK